MATVWIVCLLYTALVNPGEATFRPTLRITIKGVTVNPDAYPLG